jgi:hypothetical protein
MEISSPNFFAQIGNFQVFLLRCAIQGGVVSESGIRIRAAMLKENPNHSKVSFCDGHLRGPATEIAVRCLWICTLIEEEAVHVQVQSCSPCSPILSVHHHVMFKKPQRVESGSDRDKVDKRREYVRCNEVQVGVASPSREAWEQLLPFGRHEREEGKKIMTFAFPFSPCPRLHPPHHLSPSWRL